MEDPEYMGDRRRLGGGGRRSKNTVERYRTAQRTHRSHRGIKRHAPLRGYQRCQLINAPLPWNDEAGLKFGKRNEYKCASAHARVRHFETALADALIAIKQKIQIDNPRPPSRRIALTSVPALDRQQLVKQVMR